MFPFAALVQEADGAIRAPERGAPTRVPRAEVDVPVAPVTDVAELTDEKLLRSLSGQRFYVPHYRLTKSEALVGGKAVYEAVAHFENRGLDLRFVMGLEAIPAPALEKEAAGALPLQQECRVTVAFKRGALSRDLECAVVVEKAGLQASVDLKGDDKLALFGALNSPDLAPVVTVTRRLRVAIVVPDPKARADASRLRAMIDQLATLPIVRLEALLPSGDRGKFACVPPDMRDGAPLELDEFPSQSQALESFLFVWQVVQPLSRAYDPPARLYPFWGDFELVRMGPSGPIKTATELKKGWLTRVPVKETVPLDECHRMSGSTGGTPVLRVKMPDRTCMCRFVDAGEHRAKVIEEKRKFLAAAEQRTEAWFDVVPVELTHTVEQRLYLPKEFYPNVYRRAVGLSGGGDGRLLRIEEDGHVYFQDPSYPQRIFYFPDEFRLALQPDSSHLPNLKVRPAGEPGRFRVWYRAVPFVVAGRLEADRPGVQRQARVDEEVSFEPLSGNGVRFELRRPSKDGWSFEERPGTIKDLCSPIVDEVEVESEGLLRIVDQLIAGRDSLFSGLIRAKVPGSEDRCIAFNAFSRVRDRSALLRGIYRDSQSAACSRTITVIGDALFTPGVGAVEVSFESGDASIVLTRDRPSGEVEIHTSIERLILKQFDDGTYRYRVETISTDRQRQPSSDWRTEQDNILTLEP
jgi:hypothetical protein